LWHGSLSILNLAYHHLVGGPLHRQVSSAKTNGTMRNQRKPIRPESKLCVLSAQRAYNPSSGPREWSNTVAPCTSSRSNQCSFEVLRGRATFALLFVALTGMRIQGAARYEVNAHRWTLVSGPVEYRLAQKSSGVSFEYFGPRGLGPWTQDDQRKPNDPERATSLDTDISGQVEGRVISPELLKLVSQQIVTMKPGVAELQLVYEHRMLPLRLRANYITWADTGVITRRLVMENIGKQVLHIQRLPSLAWSLPSGQYDLNYLWGGWGQERQVGSEMLGAGERRFVSTSGRATNDYSPWFCLNNHNHGIHYLAQLAYSGNWEMNFQREPLTGDRPYWQNKLNVSLGMRFDYGGDLSLRPAETFQMPEVAFTSSGLGLDEAANQLHRYQREFVVPHNPINNPPLVQFNSWYPFPGKMTIAEMKKCADIAAKIGAEVFVLDAGWYNKKNWGTELGDYEADRQAFPNGIEELANYVRKLGMKFGIWVEIENVGVDSKIFHDHPDWCLQYNGKPIERGARRQFNFAKPEVRQWARAVIDRLARDYGIEWLKIDYNIEIGEEFDPPDTNRRPGDVLYRHLMSYYGWLDDLRAAHPRVIIENCSSGGLRFDLGIMAHANTTWLSDEVKPKPSVELAYGCTVEFTPGICNHWMVGDTEHGDVLPADTPEWWDFMFRVPMTGQFGISSRVFDWSPALVEHAKSNVALYKTLRGTTVSADVYHLTAPPERNDPTGWMALQYVSASSSKSVVMAYRLGQSNAEQTLKLHGLKPDARFQVTSDVGTLGSWTGRQLMDSGLIIKADAPWRAIAIQLEGRP
jgi:alpha-galactosidase